MKTIQLLSLALVASLSMSAENTTKLRVWIGGEKTEYELSMVDSLTFFTSTEEDSEPDPEVPLAGAFSVSADKQVKFSKGNLQCTIQGTDTAWAFAANQYEMLGTANVNGNELADKIDLFGWSGSTSTAKWGISTSTDNDYSGDFVDWGHNIGVGTTWRTLTRDEWCYLLESRTKAADLKRVARINLDETGTSYTNGLILLPDSWICPEGITFATAMGSYANNTFTLEQWEKLEFAGAVFLPAVGRRIGTDAYLVQSGGGYWSSTIGISVGAVWGMYFYDGGITWYEFNRYVGKAVRLVQDL